VKRLLILLFAIGATAQNASLKISIDSISWSDTSKGERKFKLYYRIENTGKKPVSVLLNPEHRLSSIQYGSLSNVVHYKLYEEDKALDLGDAFDRFDYYTRSRRIEIDKSDPDKMDLARRQLKEYFQMSDAAVEEYLKSGNSGDSAIVFRKRNILSEVFTLQPNESRSYQQTLFWDKRLYFKYDENEFYIDANKKHYLELIAISMREPFQNQMSKDDFAKLLAVPNFASGVFTSNRVLVNFSP
jgi:hypothetical protein